MEKQLSVTIIGGPHHNTLGVVRSLGEAKVKDIQLLLIGEHLDRNCFVAKSRYLKKDKIDFVENDEGIVPWLIEHRSNYQRVVICCSDGSSEAVISRSNELKSYYFTPSTKEDIHNLMFKQIQSNIAVSCGFDVPNGKELRIDDLDEWNSFPCIIKPSKSVLGAGKSDIIICNNRSDLENAVSTIVSDTIQVQEYVDKSLEYQLIGCSVDGGEKVIIPGFTMIIRQPPNTNTGYLKYCSINQLNYNEVAVRDFIKAIGYSGLFSLEFIRDRSGNDYFLEINMRNDGNAYCVQSAGVNLPLIWTQYASGFDYHNIKYTVENDVYFMPEQYDFKLGIKMVGLAKWIIQFFGAKSHALINLKDMKPFLYVVINRLFH